MCPLVEVRGTASLLTLHIKQCEVLWGHLRHSADAARARARVDLGRAIIIITRSETEQPGQGQEQTGPG